MVTTAVGHVSTWWPATPDRAQSQVIAAHGSVHADVRPPGDPDVPGALYGRVTDVATGQPVTGTNVRLWTAGTNAYRALTTDAQGRYRFTGVPVGTYQLQVAKAGAYATHWYVASPTTGRGRGDRVLQHTPRRRRRPGPPLRKRTISAVHRLSAVGSRNSENESFGQRYGPSGEQFGRRGTSTDNAFVIGTGRRSGR